MTSEPHGADWSGKLRFLYDSVLVIGTASYDSVLAIGTASYDSVLAIGTASYDSVLAIGTASYDSVLVIVLVHARRISNSDGITVY
jgi:thiazole synthase ThiGH ThiG subunit